MILDRADPPDVVALIDELVLHRLIGSPEIMHEQLLHVAELAERPYVCVQVVPTAAGATAGLSGDDDLASGDGGAGRAAHRCRAGGAHHRGKITCAQGRR